MKVLLDTSVWVRHFRTSNSQVVHLLEEGLVVSHEFVIGELACGSLKARRETIGFLQELVSLPTLSVDEVLILIETRGLYSRGVGLVDAQLLASTLVVPDTFIWTVDKRLSQIASEFGVSYSAS